MPKYKLSFIEDDDSAKMEVESSLSEEFEVINIPLFESQSPLYNNVNDLVNDILSANLDAVIIDYSFVDKSYQIKFDGADVVRELEKIIP